MQWKMRTGTKIMIWAGLFIALMLVWLLVVFPLLALRNRDLGAVFPHLDRIVMALTGGGGAMFLFNEIRKAVESKHWRKEDRHEQDG